MGVTFQVNFTYVEILCHWGWSAFLKQVVLAQVNFLPILNTRSYLHKYFTLFMNKKLKLVIELEVFATEQS